MKINFLGTNNWFDTKDGNTPCVLLESSDAYIIMDAGFGIYKAGKYIRQNKPIYLFITHPHLDHICGLHGLCGFYTTQPFYLVCNKQLKNYLKKIFRHPYSSTLGHKLKNFKILDINKDRQKIPFIFKTLKLNHTAPTFGYRFEIDNKIISYCLDTSFSTQAVKLGKDADIIIHECSLAPGDHNEEWGHSSPETAAKAAVLAKAKKLILHGFSPHAYTNNLSRKKAAMIAKKIFKNTAAAFDGLTINL
jgi:ribonuclease BN (tRNA processing enzyme)